jgi:lipoprotein-anchoring transpeptidase ErfK/SrfK
MLPRISRREFLKLGALALGVMAASPLPAIDAPPASSGATSPLKLGRVARRSIYAHEQPDMVSDRTEKISRDTLLELLEELASPAGPEHNPRWYRIAGGYVHSAYIQPVKQQLNTPLLEVPQAGLPAQVTMPFTQTQYQDRQGNWMPLYRLYYGSIHWITGLSQSPEGQPWYRLTDEWLGVHYYAAAEHLRPLSAEELAPISPHLLPEEKRIEVSLEKQTLTAYERDLPVYQALVSTGKRSMETPSGEFFVNRKTPSKHMGDGGLTKDPNAYEFVGVPWTSFFSDRGVAFHGTFWHDNFGTPMSAGCVNMHTAEAMWLFRWCMPVYASRVEGREDWKVEGAGTKVRVY